MGYFLRHVYRVSESKEPDARDGVGDEEAGRRIDEAKAAKRAQFPV